MKRKVFEKQIVDLQSGEVVSEEIHYHSNNAETFGRFKRAFGRSDFSLEGSRSKVIPAAIPGMQCRKT